MFKCISILLFFIASQFSFAQYIEQFPISQGNASKMFEFGNYQEAIRQYGELLKEEPNNSEFQFYLGKAYTLSTINPPKGLELLLQYAETTNKIEVENWQETLALAYWKNYEFEKAIETFEHYLSLLIEPEKKKKTEQQIAQCKEAWKLYKMPIPLSFENLGKNVNSEAPDYLPFVSPDESLLFFSTKRDGVVGNLYDYGGYKTADIYTSRHKRNNYSRARSVGSPNTYGNEETAGRSEDGQYLLYHVDSEDHFSNLFVSEKGRRSYMAPKVFGSKEVNSKDKEIAGAISNDGSTLYFSSNREGGLGGFDIYVVKRLPNGEWGLPKNIGAPVNTSGDEKFPFWAESEGMMYFSSNGHAGLGGLDLFKSQYNLSNHSWSKPQNLGYPLNTVYDDHSICFAENKRYAYVSQLRNNGFGDLDIYRVTFHEEKTEYTLLNGVIMTADSSLVKDDVTVEIIDDESGDIVGSYIMNTNTSTFNAILPPGKYFIEIIGHDKFADFSQKLILLSKNDYQANKKVHLILKPK